MGQLHGAVPLLQQQSVDQELFRFTLEAIPDCTVMQRAENVSSFLLGPWTRLLAVSTALVDTQRRCAFKHVASMGHRATDVCNVWVTAGRAKDEFVDALYLRGSTDW
jgi:hypothetical protein